MGKVVPNRAKLRLTGCLGTPTCREDAFGFEIMRCTLRFLLLLAVLAATSLGVCDGLAADAATPKRVLIIQSFGRDFAPYDTITSVFRTELARASSEPIVLFEATPDA